MKLAHAREKYLKMINVHAWENEGPSGSIPHLHLRTTIANSHRMILGLFDDHLLFFQLKSGSKIDTTLSDIYGLDSPF